MTPTRNPLSVWWRLPATPLQAARYARQWYAHEAAARVREICTGHRGRRCAFHEDTLYGYETGRVRPSPEHAVCLMRLYGTSAQELGLQAPLATTVLLAVDGARLTPEARGWLYRLMAHPACVQADWTASPEPGGTPDA